jgi:SPASM domain peptide maturase of grasp-with-spasm system
MEYFKLFANCILVKGAKQSIICDLQKQKTKNVPNLLFEIINIKQNLNLNINEIKSYFENRYDEGIDLFFNDLFKNEWGFYTTEIDRFPALSMEWDYPMPITNILLDITNTNLKFIENTFKQISSIGCETLQIRCYDDISVDFFENTFCFFDQSRIRSIEIITKYNSSFTKKGIISLHKKYQRLISVLLHSSPLKFDKKTEFVDERVILFFTSKEINSHLCCGVFKIEYFVPNIPHFTEAQKHNTCLNRKISIDTEGYIRNCPSMKEHYGNIKDTTLQEALEHPDFKKYWFINKDQVAVCKDCEFRYICTDCRAYIENPEDMYSKPLKCGYNPYTCEWEEWSTNPLKQKAIDHYGMREMVENNG